jgi:PhnB protein
MRVLSPNTLNGSSVSFVLDVADADAAFQRALDAGARVERPLRDEPYGRAGWVVDPFGYRWSIMTADPDFRPEGTHGT